MRFIPIKVQINRMRERIKNGLIRILHSLLKLNYLKYRRNKEMVGKIAAIAMFVMVFNLLATAQKYSDGRPEASLRMVAKDHG